MCCWVWPLHVRVGNWNLGPHACKASHLPAESSPWATFFFFCIFFSTFYWKHFGWESLFQTLFQTLANGFQSNTFVLPNKDNLSWYDGWRVQCVLSMSSIAGNRQMIVSQCPENQILTPALLGTIILMVALVTVPMAEKLHWRPFWPTEMKNFMFCSLWTKFVAPDHVCRWRFWWAWRSQTMKAVMF